MASDPNNKIEEQIVLHPKDDDTESLTIYSLKEDFINNIFFVRKMKSGKKELVAQAEFDSSIDDESTMVEIKTLNYNDGFRDNDNFYIRDIIDFSKREIPQLSDIKINQESDFYQSTNENINNPFQRNKQFNGPTLKDKTRIVTPVFLMEELIEMKMVELKSREISGNQTRYKFRIGSEQFNITMTSKEVFFNQKGFEDQSNYAYNDWRHTGAGGYNGINLLNHLMNFNILKGEVFQDARDQYVKAGRYIIDNVINRIEKKYGFNKTDAENLQKLEFTENSGSIYALTHFDRLPIDLTNRIGKYKPATDASQKWKNWLIDSRKLSAESVNELFKRKLFYIGQPVVMKKIGDVEPSTDRAKMIGILNNLNQQQDNSFYSRPQLNFIGLDKNGQPSFAESIKEMEDKETKKMKIDKKHLHKSSPFGSAFKLIQDNPKITIISEAVIDGVSAWDLFKIAGYNGNDFNIVATGGTSHMHSFLEDNFSIKLEFEKPSQNMKISFVNKEDVINDIDEDRKTYLKERFSMWRFQYVLDAKDNVDEIKQKLEALEPIIGGPFLIREQKQKDRNSTFWEKDVQMQTKDLIFDYTNFDKFLTLNGLSLQKNENDEYEVKDFYINKKIEDLTQENKQIIIDQIKEQFKTTSIAFAYDNDDAGQKYFPLVELLKNELNIEVYNLTPQKLKISEGIQYQNKVDVNDILKTFRKHLDNNPDEAQNLLEDFIQPLYPDYLCLDNDIKRIQKIYSKGSVPKERMSP